MSRKGQSFAVSCTLWAVLQLAAATAAQAAAPRPEGESEQTPEAPPAGKLKIIPAPETPPESSEPKDGPAKEVADSDPGETPAKKVADSNPADTPAKKVAEIGERPANDPAETPPKEGDDEEKHTTEIARAQSDEDDTVEISADRITGEPPLSQLQKPVAAAVGRPEEKEGKLVPEPREPAATDPRPSGALPTLPTAKDPGPSGALPTAKDRRPNGALSPTIRLDFEGGSLREFLDVVEQAVRDTPRLHCNVAVNDPAAAELVKLPRITLEQASVDAVMQVAGLVAGIRDFVITIDRLAVPDEHPTFVVIIEKVEKKEPPPPERKLQVLSLTELLGKDEADEQDEKELQGILAAIELALELRDPSEASKTVVRFHAESGLLLVNGREHQIEVIRSVVSRISEDRSSQRQRRTLLEENEQLRTQLSRLKSRVQTQESHRLRMIDELETSVIKLGADLAAVQRQADQSREYYEKARRSRDVAYEKLVEQNVELKTDIRNAEQIVGELRTQIADLKKKPK